MTEFSRTESTYTDDTIAVMRDTITALREQVAELRQTNDELKAAAEALAAKFAGPRCDICGNLCVDLAKDEHGRCPDCSALDGVTP